MKIILNQDVYNLGEEGDVCVVANGYARNFLLPQNMAVLFNKQNSAIFQSRKIAIEKRKEEKRAASAGLKEKIEALTLELTVSTADTGKLFGSVTNANIAEELKKAGVIIERKKIELPEHTIKMVGEFIGKVKLYGTESADLKIIIKTDKKVTEPVKDKKPAMKKIIDKEDASAIVNTIADVVVEDVKAEAETSEERAEVSESADEA